MGQGEVGMGAVYSIYKAITGAKIKSDLEEPSWDIKSKHGGWKWHTGALH